MPELNLAHLSWTTALGAAYLLVASLSVLHVLLNKDNERAVISWIGLIVLSPFLGSLLYWLFGINRIKRRAQRTIPQDAGDGLYLDRRSHLKQKLPDHWQALMNLGYSVHQTEYSANNAIVPLLNGDAAYPAMLDAIEAAQTSVVLSSYIFVYDETGRQFVTSLSAAHERGVQVRVLIDGIGIDYGWHKTDRALRSKGVKTARFLPTISLSGARFINLRNHR